MSKFRTKNKWVSFVAGILIAVTAFGALFALVSPFGKDVKTIGAGEFSVGGLDPETGKYVERKDAIYTPDAFSAQGLTITPDFETADVEYQIFFYDEAGRFLEATDVLTEGYAEQKLLPTYARVVIYPSTLDEDGHVIEDYKVGLFGVREIAKSLTITVDAEQNKVYSSNLFEVGETAGVSDHIEIDGFDGVLLHLASATVTDTAYTVTFYAEKTDAEGVTSMKKLDDLTVTLQNYSDGEFMWYTVDKLPAGATHMTITYYDTNTNIGVYGIDR